MSVDKTIEELSGTLAQLSTLVEHINGQIVGVTSRINQTLDNFDQSVAGIATDASSLTGQVADTVSQIPNSWIFYLLFITLIIVLILLSILIVINLATRLHAIYSIWFPNTESGMSTPLPSNYSESRLISNYENTLHRVPKRDTHVINIDNPGMGQVPYTIDSGLNPSYQPGYQSSRSNIVSPKLTTFRVSTAAQTNTVEVKNCLQRPPTPAIETICDSFVHHDGSQILASIYEENSDLILESVSPGFLRPESQNKPRRSLPTVECNSSGHIVVSRKISQNQNDESWIPLVFGDDSEISPPPPAPEEVHRVVTGQTTFQHVPYSRRNQQLNSAGAQSNTSSQDPQGHQYPYQPPNSTSLTANV